MEIKPDIRYLNDVKKVLFDKKWLKKADNFELYYMYRGIKRKNDLRYDITIIPSKMLGQEFVKTKGHHHQGKHGEVYIVLKGQAIYLLQQQAEKDQEIKDVYAVKAKKNDVIIVPPFYGHVTINPGKEKLETANWLFDKCESNYNIFEKMSGACYFYTEKGWIKNNKYKKVPKLKFKKPLKKIPKNLNFL